jgi:hypothetical protein
VRVRAGILAAMWSVAAAGCGSGPAQDERADGPDPIGRPVSHSGYFELLVGQSSQPLVVVFEHDGQLDSVPARRVIVEDSSVIGVANGAIVARGVGRSDFTIAIGDARFHGMAHVSESVFAGTVTLAPSESRAWELGIARYEIAVRPTSRGAPSPLELVADITCATDGRDAELIHCIVRQPTRFVLRHSASRGAAASASAYVSITRVP